MLQPRPYQAEAQKRVLLRWKKGVTRQLISLPTGCGKTIIFGMLAESLRERTLVLAHREELLLQAQQKIRLVYPDADIGILKAQEKSGLDTEICIASVQTAARNTKALKERGFKLLICDEAHHAVSPSYMKIFSELGFTGDDKSKLLLGVTATAYR
ncbi:MAG: DEAD/DEAH box helicase family protein, partial [Synergistaceae bacterium]|nr:DEAD/DEAH box helicase family protein [Synergistaceae bacterium]